MADDLHGLVTQLEGLLETMSPSSWIQTAAQEILHRKKIQRKVSAAASSRTLEEAARPVTFDLISSDVSVLDRLEGAVCFTSIAYQVLAHPENTSDSIKPPADGLQNTGKVIIAHKMTSPTFQRTLFVKPGPTPHRAKLKQWNDTIANSVMSHSPIVTMLYAIGHRLWINFDRLLADARSRGRIVPTIDSLFREGVKFYNSVDKLPVPRGSDSELFVSSSRPQHSPSRVGQAMPRGASPERRRASVGHVQEPSKDAPTAAESAPHSTTVSLASQPLKLRAHRASAVVGRSSALQSEASSLFARPVLQTTVEPPTMEVDVHESVRKLLRRVWRVAALAATYRRRLVFILMMDRVDNDAKIRTRLKDLVQQLRGVHAPAHAIYDMLRVVGPGNRKVFYDRLSEGMRAQSLVESAEELPAERGLVDAARQLCGCGVFRDSIGKIAVEQMLRRRVEEPEELDASLTSSDALTALQDLLDDQAAATTSAPSTHMSPLKVRPKRMSHKSRRGHTTRFHSNNLVISPEDIEAQLAVVSNAQISREVLLMHTELQRTRSELEIERTKRMAAEAEVLRLRALLANLQQHKVVGEGPL